MPEARKARRTVGKKKLINRVVRGPRQPGEVATRKYAIRNFCLECMGYNAAEVRRCTAPECWLYPYRLGRGETPLAAEVPTKGIDGISRATGPPKRGVEIHHGEQAPGDGEIPVSPESADFGAGIAPETAEMVAS